METVFGRNTTSLACGITIPASSENHLLARGDIESSLAKLLHHWFKSALEDKGILAECQIPNMNEDPLAFAWHLNKGLALFQTTDWRQAFAIIKDRLAALRFLDFAQISYMDGAEGIWRPLHPKENSTFDPMVFLTENRPKE